ncbi:hypothetical protein ONZ45_g17433 [Pleurotus djamor]|nr:hypothetical protein ONZ45_g17433 [Pleurotus djamor]
MMASPPEAQQVWAPPQFVFKPSLDSQTVTPNPYTKTNFARQAKWCADGSCFLAASEDNQFQLFSTPPSSHAEGLRAENDATVIEVPQPSPIVEYAWFPTASPMDPATFCFAASVRERPVQLLHGSDGRLRASYPIVDHRERFIAPHSLAFAPTMDRLYCGFEDAIEVFDLGAPGHPGTRLHTSPSKKSKDGLKGIVAALAFTPYSPQGGYFAAGSLSPSLHNICVYDESQDDAPLFYLGTGSDAVRAGVTQLAFNHTQPHLLYASFRRHPSIYVWDLRGTTSEPVQSYESPSSESMRTNQKLKFDVDSSGKWLAAGGPDGKVSVWDLNSLPVEAGDQSRIEPSYVIDAHNGSRHFDSQTDSDSESESGSDDSDAVDSEDRTGPFVHKRGRHLPFTTDNSIKIWESEELLEVLVMDPPVMGYSGLRHPSGSCRAFADPYVEHPSLTLFIDLILLKRGVYRHLLFNRGTEPRRSHRTENMASSTGKPNLLVEDPKREQRRWLLVIRLGGALVLLDAFIRWSQLRPAGIPPHGPKPWNPETTRAFVRTLLGCLSETVAFHSGVVAACYLFLSTSRLWPASPNSPSSGTRSEFRFSLVPLALFYSSLTKFFLLFLLAIWQPSTAPIRPSKNVLDGWIDVPLISSVTQLLDDDKIDRAWVIRNVLGGMSAGFGLRIILDFHPVFSMIIILIGWGAKTVIARGVIRCPSHRNLMSKSQLQEVAT